METNAFASLAKFNLPTGSRLLPSSCCPDKDLVLLISRLGGVDRMSLWNSNQGSKVWEADVGEDNSSTHILGLSWSPDAQSIAVIHDPPSVSLHSLQDGHNQLSLRLDVPSNSQKHACRLTGICWFRKENINNDAPVIPDIFKRNDVITGTAHSILRTLPLLDNFREESEKLTVTDLFAFQGSQTHPNPKPLLPDFIDNWPTLSSESVTASIGSPSHNKLESTREILDEKDDSNLDSILLATDNLGHLYCFLDGTFPLGVISLRSDASFASILKHPLRPTLFGHIQTSLGKTINTQVHSLIVDIPSFGKRKVRDLAILSSTARELVWYIMRIVKEMRAIWFGSESTSGARELGPKWVRALEAKQKDQFGLEEPTPILDLTCLLTTGRPSDSLLDFLASGEQMSERGIQKWESTMTEALVKLRDFSEKKVAPAYQRLHLVLEELQGWAKLSQYSLFELPSEDLDFCVESTSRGIVVASWLTAVSRRELSRFREFILWLRFEINNINSLNDNISRHDILEVNNYFKAGLVVSSIDKWFLGPVPRFLPEDLGIPERGVSSLAPMIERARIVATKPLVWQGNVTHKDLGHLDRNLDALIHDLAVRCRRIFSCAAGQASGSATVSGGHRPGAERSLASGNEWKSSFSIHERITMNKSGEILEHLVGSLSGGHSPLLLVQLRFSIEASGLPLEIGVALLECHLPEEGQEESQPDIEILEADFFDEESVVIVYRLQTRERPAFIATLDYSDMTYQKFPWDGHVRLPDREDLMRDVLKSWKEGQLSSVRTPIKRRRALAGCKDGGVSLAVNGRVNRRVACVLDASGTRMESFDLEGDGEDMEVVTG